jgi:hypothetical protein
MALAFTRIEIADAERARILARSLAGLRAPSGEDWLGRLSARVPGGPWEILLSGPRRHFVGEWETTVVSLDRELYRRLVPPELQNVDGVRRLVRGLLWDRVTVIVDESSDSLLARQMEDAVWDVVTRTGLHQLEVRLARWPSAWGDIRFVGTVERHDLSESCIVWCGVVRTAGDLTRCLSAALRPAPVDAPVDPASLPAAVRDPQRASTTSLSLAALAASLPPGGVS